MHDVLEPYCEALQPSHDLDLEDAIGGSMTVGAKIAGGYATRDDDDMLGGCIVRCRRGLEAAQKAFVGLEAIARSGVEWSRTVKSRH